MEVWEGKSVERGPGNTTCGWCAGIARDVVWFVGVLIVLRYRRRSALHVLERTPARTPIHGNRRIVVVIFRPKSFSRYYSLPKPHIIGCVSNKLRNFRPRLPRPEDVSTGRQVSTILEIIYVHPVFAIVCVRKLYGILGHDQGVHIVENGPILRIHVFPFQAWCEPVKTAAMDVAILTYLPMTSLRLIAFNGANKDGTKHLPFFHFYLFHYHYNNHYYNHYTIRSATATTAINTTTTSITTIITYTTPRLPMTKSLTLLPVSPPPPPLSPPPTPLPHHHGDVDVGDDDDDDDDNDDDDDDDEVGAGENVDCYNRHNFLLYHLRRLDNNINKSHNAPM
ncbi:hypothetical protein MAR_036677 [Mya arenaria]|uniref:Uncharacterized protein n=1 Tax=Mya arenaria TaxID=6604 RepID=A0ABY7FLD0_MYAAR|nr:hypothetical protein MAR_036677 [Mya arenaria]